ncbi:hypothetical protein RB594_005952 [Gaeumannomyces avenae]
MSTPTTATATHPHYHHYGGHFSHPQPYPAPPASYPILPPGARLAPYQTYSTPSLSGSHAGSNGINLAASSPSSVQPSRQTADIPQLLNPIPRQHLSDDSLTHAMPATTAVSRTQLADLSAGARKRRRSKGPDWHTFYKNGLPKEVIVIDDDTPEPDSSQPQSQATAASRALVNGAAVAVNGYANGLSAAIEASSSSSTNGRPLAKKRKRDGEPTRYDAVHNGGDPSHANTPAASSYNHIASPSASTISSDRNTSANHTTAPTSLGSASSIGGQYDDVQAGQKRKRTRQQVADQAKRREIALYGAAAFATYQPPTRPIKKAADVNVRVVHDPNSKGVKVDDDDGHYIVIPDAELTNDYQMLKLLGQGTFGKVVQARDRRRNELVAIKIIRSVQKYRDASRIELRVLQTLKLNDAENRNRCIHLRDTFDYRGHICIVMDLLGQSVFDFLKGNSFVPFPNSQIQSFARQLLTSVAFLHDLNLIHTDLKPENILLADATYQTFTYNRKIPSSSTTVSRQATQRKVLLDTEIRLIDFGSATFQDEYHSSVVSTRHYRAPEIILGLGWSYPCDIWSIGCILVEFFTGDALFQTHDNLEHLAMMEAVCDRKMDTHLVQKLHRPTRNGPTNPAAKYVYAPGFCCGPSEMATWHNDERKLTGHRQNHRYFRRTRLDYPTQETTRASKRYVKAMKKLPVCLQSLANYRVEKLTHALAGHYPQYQQLHEAVPRFATEGIHL